MTNKTKFLSTCALLVSILATLTACGLNIESSTNSSQAEESQPAQPIIQKDSHEPLKAENLDTLQRHEQSERQAPQRTHAPAARKTAPLEIEEDDMPRLD